LDKPRTPNPLMRPDDQVLKSVIYLESDLNFKIFTNWLGGCYAAGVNRSSAIKDEVELRWNQGQCQALLLINKALTQAHEELRARMAELEKNQINRNG